MAQHTPGPWKVGFVENGHGEPVQDVAILYLPDGGQIEIRNSQAAGANAALIAAAPDLLAHLSLLSVMRSLFNNTAINTAGITFDVRVDGERRAVLNIATFFAGADAAIAKAEGRS